MFMCNALFCLSVAAETATQGQEKERHVWWHEQGLMVGLWLWVEPIEATGSRPHCGQPLCVMGTQVVQ